VEKAAEYRGIAEKFRREAMQAPLPQQRQLALNAAQRWEALAEDIERAIAPTVALRGGRADWMH
jgi:hypothetical protein